MAKPTVNLLQSWFQRTSRSWGWDMIVAYDRRTMNDLLLKQYLGRYGSIGDLPLISESIELSSSTEHLFELQLRFPRVSFERDSLGSGKVRLSLDFLGGLIMTETHPDGGVPLISTIRRIEPVEGPQLTLAVPLADVKVSVDDGRTVVLDLSHAEDFSANFVLDSLSQQAIGLRFKEIFGRLSKAQKTFALGTVWGELPVPKNIVMRVMGAPGADDPASPTYGEGALIMFVRLFQPFDGSMPIEGGDFMFPVAADEAKHPYNMTMMLFNESMRSGSGAKDDVFPFTFDDVLLYEDQEILVHAVAISSIHFDNQMAFYGEVALKKALFALQPQMPIIAAQGAHPFFPAPAASSLKWSVRGLDAGDTNVGAISNAGVYTPPPASSLVYGQKTVKVTAEGVVEGKRSSGSTLVTVVRSAVAVSPQLQVCFSGNTVNMSAALLPGSQQAPVWRLRSPQQGATLSASSGGTCTYTAASAGDGPGEAVYMDIVEVSNPATGDVQLITILVTRVVLSVPFFISEHSRPETNLVKLQVLAKGQVIDVEDIANFSINVLGYERGRITDDLSYSAPADATGFVALHLIVPDAFNDFHGLLVLPLPLWAYAEIVKRASRSVLASSIKAPGAAG